MAQDWVHVAIGKLSEKMHRFEQRIESLERIVKRLDLADAKRGAQEAANLVINYRSPLYEELKNMPNPFLPPTCGSCRWFSGGGENPAYNGVCLRFPPLAQPFDSVRGEYGRALFPLVDRDRTCGEHAPR